MSAPARLATRAGRVAQGWCATYTGWVPADVRARRREELDGHLWEHERLGWPFLVPLLRGMLDDLRWCDAERRRAGAAPLLVATVIGRSGGLVFAGVLMVMAFVVSLITDSSTVTMVLPTFAAAVLITRSAASFRRRRAP